MTGGLHHRHSRTQAAMGWIGGKQIKLADVEIAAATRNATVAVQSLDDSPISEANRTMISRGARSIPTGGNQSPFHSEPVLGQINIWARKGFLQAQWRGSARAQDSHALRAWPLQDRACIGPQHLLDVDEEIRWD